MSKNLPSRPAESPNLRNPAFALVVSEYNPRFTRQLEASARAELAGLAPDAAVCVHHVPGAFEIPLAVKLLAETGEFNAIIALGIILRGETNHADLVAASVTDALQQIALDNRTPVIHEVLLLANEVQAETRCSDPAMNRGTEAARAAVAAAATVAAIKQT